MWSNRLNAVMDQMVPFNHELLQEYHERRIYDIPYVLEALFKQSVSVINSRCPEEDEPFRYISFDELGPEERVHLLKSKITFETKYSIRPTRKRVLRFRFEYRGEHHAMLVDVPYLHHNHVLVNGTKYYPLFAITDRGGLSRHGDTLILQVMRTRLRFIREKQMRLSTVEGDQLTERPISAKIHQGTKGRNKNTPIIFFTLAKYGLNKTLELFGAANAISIVDTIDVSGDYRHIAIPNGMFMQIASSVVGTDSSDPHNTNVKRLVMELFSIYKYYEEFTKSDLYNKGYYIMALGTWTNTSVKSESYLFKNATEFLEMNETLIDPVWKRQHESIGISYESLDDLLVFMSANIDRLLVENKNTSNNLLHKKLAGADMIISGMVTSFNKKMFHILNNRQKGLNIKGMMHYQPYTNTITRSELFEPAPSMYSDNTLAVLGKRFMAYTDVENASGRSGAAKRTPNELLTAHFSFPAVCSIFTYPSSNPIVAGSINPHVQVDMATGNIQEPDFIEELSEIYGKQRSHHE